MAVTSLAITQDNIYNGVDLLATDSPLKFICQLTDTAATPPYSFPDYVEVEITDLLRGDVYTGYRAYQIFKGANICRYIFQVDKIIRMIMGSFDDPNTDTIQGVNNLVRQFRVQFIYSTLSDSVDFFAYRAARQVGQREAMIEIADNKNEIVYGFKDRELYLHYYVGVADSIKFDEILYFGVGMIRLRKTPTNIGTSNILVKQRKPSLFTTVYGYLYNKKAVIDSGKFISTAMVTEGWRVPSSTDVTNLLTYAGNDVLKLKSCRMVDNTASVECNTTVHPRWNAYTSYEGTNETQFSALPNGVVNENGVFIGLGDDFYIILSDSAAGSTKVANIYANTLVIAAITQYAGVGVRLVRDATTDELLLPDGEIRRAYYSGNDGRNYLCYKVGSQVWTPFLAETKLNDNTVIFQTAKSPGNNWYENTNRPMRAAYNYVNSYIGVEDYDYYLAKTITLNVLPNCETGLYVKFLDSTTGYYKFWLFDRYFEQNFKHSSIGVVENFTENLLNSGQRMVGRKATPSISVVESGMEQAHIDYIAGLFTSPRIYIWRDSTWIPVSIEDGTTITKYRKGNAKDFAITFIEEDLNTVTML